MVLQGDEEGFSPPFDASLFGATHPPTTPGTEYTIDYTDCEAVCAFFTLDQEIEGILPEGIEPLSNPPRGGFMVTHYPFSTVGAYDEVIAVLEVADTEGERAYYIPYIYVTNDAAMAAGRELVGAPKKQADVGIERVGDSIRATLDRPDDQRLLTMTTTPDQRGADGLLESILPSPTPLLSVRHVPPIEGGDGLTQLVEWYVDLDFHTSENGAECIWLGPTDVSFDTRSTLDPVHRLEPRDLIAGLYIEFDMELGVRGVAREWEV